MSTRTSRDLVSIILTGGQATRMRPLSDAQSKAMLPFLGRPLLTYLLHDLAAAGLTRILMTSRGRDDDIQSYFGNGAKIGVYIDYLPSGVWAGTAGAVLSVLGDAYRTVSSPFLVIYGDSLLRIDYGALLDFHRASGASFTIACHRPRFEQFLFDSDEKEPPRTNYGVLDLQPDGRVTRFEEKPYLDEIKTTFVRPVANAAVYVVEPSALSSIPAPSSSGLDFGFDLLPFLIARGDSIYGMDIAPGFRLDVGTLPHYMSVQLAALLGKLPLLPDPVLPPNGICVEDGAIVHPEATLIPPVFVGAGARVETRALVAASVICKETLIGEMATVRNSIILDCSTIGTGARVDGSILGARTSIVAGVIVPNGTVVGAWSRIGGPELMLSETNLGGLVGGGG
jgi:mannose-1-phosphate guanylyltransferase/phosphomannomutase